MDKKIAVIGSTGFVGKALTTVLKAYGYPVIEYHVDSPMSATKEEVNVCDMAFVCVPTPMLPNGECDISIVEEVVEWLATPLIIIKSTVPVETTMNLIKATGKNIIHNPEFLREASALHDTLNPNFVIVGGYSPEIAELYGKLYPNITPVYLQPEESELAKYAINAFLAYKVTFFNELKALCNALEVDFEWIRVAMTNDWRVGPSHTEVTAEGGFGGHCFPKDLNALIKSAQAAGYEPEVLKSTWNANRRFRDEFKGEEFNFYED